VHDDPEGVVEDIAATRARLQSTVEALSYKTDVSARAEETVDGITTELTHRIEDAKVATSEAYDDFTADVAERARVLGHETSVRAHEAADRANGALGRASETTTVLVRGLTPAHVARAAGRGIASRPLVLVLLGLALMLLVDVLRTGPRRSPEET